MSNNISHIGYVKEINKNRIIVCVKVVEACASCSSKHNCTLTASGKEREIEVYTDNYNNFNVNDKVIIKTKEKNAWIAILLIYVLPIIFFVSTYFIILKVSNNEFLSGLLSFWVLVLHFLVIYLLRKKISKKIVFEIEKL